jgi:hypothetical protein
MSEGHLLDKERALDTRPMTTKYPGGWSPRVTVEYEHRVWFEIRFRGVTWEVHRVGKGVGRDGL